MQFANISTRLSVGTGDNVLIGGFIVTGSNAKRVYIRGLGEASLSVKNSLPDTLLELHDSGGTLLAENDDWENSPNKDAISATGIPPQGTLESAILTTLKPGEYTTILKGVENQTGIGLVEIYDLDRTVDSKLANISTRGFVQTGDNVMIGGFIILGTESANTIIRAIGPSLPVIGALADPTLELHDGNGATIASNDNWRSDQEDEISATGLAPINDAESAILTTLPPGPYTAILRGNSNTTGIALVEAYQLGD